MSSFEYRGYQIGQRTGSKKFRVFDGAKQIEVALDQAKAVIDERIKRLNQAADLSHVPSVRVKDVLAEYEKWARGQRDSTTVNNVLLTWRSFEHITWLHEVTADVVKKVKDSHTTWSAGSQRAYLFNVRSVLTFASEENGNRYLIDPMVKQIDLPKHFPKKKDAAKEEHVVALLNYYKHSNWRLLFVAMAFVEWGLRPATVPAILKSDVHGDHIYLRAEDDRTKTKQDTVLIISDEIKPLVERAIAENQNEFLFNDSDATPWSVQGIESIMKRLHKAKVLPPNITWYAFRIAKDNEYIEEGVNPQTHATMMNHGISMLKKIYSRVNIKQEIERRKGKTKHQYKDESGKVHYFDTKEQLIEFLGK